MAMNNTTLSSLVLIHARWENEIFMRNAICDELNLISSVNSSGGLLRYLAISLDETVLVDRMDIWNSTGSVRGGFRRVVSDGRNDGREIFARS